MYKIHVMKKTYTRLIFFALLCFSLIPEAKAQIHSSMLNIKFTDALGNQLSVTPEVYIRNTDSVGHPAYPYVNRNIYTGNPGFYIDSCIWDSSFQDTMVSIHYYACGQWHTLDTFFHLYASWLGSGYYADLNLDIQLSCIQPCNSDFYRYSYSPQAFQVWVNSNQKGNNIHHLWLFGDGHSDTGDYEFHSYADTGTYIIQHIVFNSVSMCSDTTWDTVSFYHSCNAYFNSTAQSNGTFSFSFFSGSYGIHDHHWDMGDGTTRIDSSGFMNHTYNTTDTFLVRHIVSVPGQCADTTYDTVYNYNANCTFNYSSISKSNYTVTIVPNNANMSLFYDFGDGNTHTGTGTVQHTYAGNGYYQLKMQDAAKQCTVKINYVHIDVPCYTYFTVTDLGNYTVRLRNPGGTSGTSLFYFGDGDSAIADSVNHTYASNPNGYYLIEHKILNGSGHVICAQQTYIYFDPCGNSNYSPNYGYTYLYGQLLFDDTIRTDYDSAVVYLILHDSANGTLTLIDSLVRHSSQYDSGYFQFSPVCYPKGTRFLVKAALMAGTTLYSDFLPTYSDTSVLWSGATPYPLGYYATINMRRGTNPGGPGFIGGFISQGANKSGAALDGIQVTLLRSDGLPVAYVLSANAGRYEFHNLAYGSYRVLVEIPGKPSEEYTLVLNSASESYDDLDFEVNSTDITTKMTSIRNSVQEDLKLYPNPADHSLFVEWTGGAAEVELLDVNGKTWLRTSLVEGTAVQKIDVSALSPGSYFIRINDGITLRHQLISIR